MAAAIEREELFVFEKYDPDGSLNDQLIYSGTQHGYVVMLKRFLDDVNDNPSEHGVVEAVPPSAIDYKDFRVFHIVSGTGYVQPKRREILSFLALPGEKGKRTKVRMRVNREWVDRDWEETFKFQPPLTDVAMNADGYMSSTTA